MMSSIELPPWQVLIPYLVRLVRILVILGAAMAGNRLVSGLIKRLRRRIVTLASQPVEKNPEAVRKRAVTIGSLLRTTAAVAIWSVAIVMSLREAGFDIGPLLAGAGVAGIALGIGAQNLVRDVIGGVFLLVENQIRVGDVVQLDGTGGLVEEINLRTTVLRGLDGAVHIVPNGEIRRVTNMTREFSYYVFNMGVAYREDTDRVAAVMKEVAAELAADEGFAAAILEPLEILGVDEFADSAVIIKARIKTKPIEQWRVGRELNRRFKKRFDELGIEIPFPQVSVNFPGESRAALKEMVREVLAEEKRLSN